MSVDPPLDPDALAAAIAAARAWAEQDPDEQTRAELHELADAADAGDVAASDELVERFASRLDFGTAGLRGPLGAGPSRMNRVLVSQAAAGLAAYLLSRHPHPSVVIGYDGRHKSDVFARDTAEIMAGAGIRVVLLPQMLPTPVLAFAIRHLQTSAGVMVTASHNPAADNGYKVYLGGPDGGSQIVPPADVEIQAAIRDAASRPIAELPRSTDYETAGAAVAAAYVRETAKVATVREPLSYVYTPLHGVGGAIAHRVFAAAGFPEPIPVPAQAEPDPDFPTVVFPNPEEEGALDLAFAAASAAHAQLVIANDPDADRLAVGVPDGKGSWRRLSGNEVGWLLGWQRARAVEASGADTATLACSLVSSPALKEIARKYALDFVETLTGFKWISRAGGLVFGYEEALGYLVDPDKVRDKDGISAAVAILSLFSELQKSGTSLDEHFAQFAERFGGYASAQISIRVDDVADIADMMTALRAHFPTEVGGVRVAQIDDFRQGFGQFPPTDLLRLHLVGGGRVIVRPSGTEPKLKCYLDAVSTDGTAAERIAAATATVATLEAGMRALLEPASA